MSALTNEEILSDDPASMAVEAEEPLEYTPEPTDSDGVVVVEPKIITIGRKKRRREMRDMQNPTSNS